MHTNQTPTVNRGATIWSFHLPQIVLQRCAGNPLLLAAWVIVAGLLAEDEGLRPGRFRTVAETLTPLTQQLGLGGQPPIVAEALLLALGDLDLLTISDGYLALPMPALMALSLEAAQRRLAAAEQASIAPSPRPRQGALPGLAD